MPRAFYREKKQMRGGQSNGDRVVRAFGGPKINLSSVQSCVKTFLISFETHPLNVPLPTPKLHYGAILFCIDKSSLGVFRIGVATPWDDCPYAKSNANTFVRAHAYRVFLTSCVGINLGDIPSVDPSTLGRKTLYELASLKYCYIA